MKIKKWWIKTAVTRFLLPVVRKNYAAALLLRTLADGGSWADLMQGLARLLGLGSHLEILDRPALPIIREAVDKADGPGDVGVVALDALTKPFKERKNK